MAVALFSLVLAGNSARAQAPADGRRLDTALVNFFCGQWKGEGTFSNGRPIAAGLSFRLSLDSAWLVCEHRDEPPNPGWTTGPSAKGQTSAIGAGGPIFSGRSDGPKYKATLFWGVDASTGQFTAFAFDNFHGHRQFGSNGWVDGRIVLTTQSFAPGAGVYFEHFIYERVSATSFRMTYETSRDAITWRMGDSLVFSRSAK